MTLIEFKHNRADALQKTTSESVLTAAFPQSPSLVDYKDKDVAALMELLHDGIVSGNPDFPSFSLDFAGAPDLSSVKGGNNDKSVVWTPYSPAPGSPGPGLGLGAADALKVPPPPAETPPSSGAGSTLSPNGTSKAISSQEPNPKGGNNVPPGNLSSGHSGA